MELIKKSFFDTIKDEWIVQSGGLKESDFMREVSFALQHIHKNALLQKCDQSSFLKAIMNLSQVGLTLNPIAKYAYLVPRWNKKINSYEAVLEPDYRGLQKLLTDTGVVKNIACNVIYEGDKYNIDMSSEKKVLEHVPHWLSGNEKGKILGVYSNALLSDGSYHFEGMSYKDICDIRDRSESYAAYVDGKIKTCIWVSDEPEMCRKTVIKRHYKYLPKSDGKATERLQNAIELDNQLHGFEEPVDFGLMTLIEEMIYRSSLDDKKKAVMTRRMNALGSKSEAFKMIEELKDSQPIIGMDRPPLTAYEQVSATRERADREDFKERQKNGNQ